MIRCLTLAALLVATPALAKEKSADQAASLIGPAIRVTDVARSIRYYSEAFGMSVATELDFGTMHEVILGFSKQHPQPGIIFMHDNAPGKSPPVDHGNGFSRIVLRIVNLETVAARLTAAGFAAGDIHNASKGYRIMNVTDPDGYRLELVESKPEKKRNGGE